MSECVHVCVCGVVCKAAEERPIQQSMSSTLCRCSCRTEKTERCVNVTSHFLRLIQSWSYLLCDCVLVHCAHFKGPFTLSRLNWQFAVLGVFRRSLFKLPKWFAHVENYHFSSVVLQYSIPPCYLSFMCMLLVCYVLSMWNSDCIYNQSLLLNNHLLTNAEQIAVHVNDHLCRLTTNEISAAVVANLVN